MMVSAVIEKCQTEWFRDAVNVTALYCRMFKIKTFKGCL